MATTKANQWKSTYEVQLPSGYIAELRPLGADMILKCQHVPDVISSLVVRMFKGGSTQLEIEEFKHVQEFSAFLDECCALCFVHPQVVEHPEGDDQISAEMISFADKSFVFNTLSQAPRWLENFRPEPTGDVPPVPEEPVVSPTTEPTPEAESLAEAQSGV